MARTSLPPEPGYRFHPTDVELIMYYLKRKITGKKFHSEAISELNIYKFSPWDLPDKSCSNSKDLEWYFLCPRERKYASGDRMKRGTESGYWKTTGKDRSIMYDGRTVGMVKTLVFHEGNAPQGNRTDWLLHEYRMDDKNLADAGVAQDGYVLCRVFKKDGKGPKHGAHYGGPFREEEWDIDDPDCAINPSPCDRPSSVVITTPENQNSVASRSLSVDEAGPSVQTSSNNVLVGGLNNSMVTGMFDPQSQTGCTRNDQGLSSARPSTNDIIYLPDDDDIAHMLETYFPNEQENYELGDLGHHRENAAAPHLDEHDPFNGLEDLNTGVELSGGAGFSPSEGHNINNMLAQDDMQFLELNDLNTPLNSPADSGGFVGASSGILSSGYSSGAYLGQISYNVNSHSSGTVHPRLSQFSLCPDSSGRHVDPTNVFPQLQGNAYGNIISQGSTSGYGLHSFPDRQPEESGDATGSQERGMPQRKFFSRLQRLLESISVHPASVLAPSNSAYGGSSIHVKAEVTHRFSSCTKDALSFVLEESTYDYSCWWNLHGAEFWKKVADCSGGSVVFYLGKFWILCGYWSVHPLFSTWLLFVGMHFLFQDDCLLCQGTKIPVFWNSFFDILNRFRLVTNSFFSFMLCWFAIDFVLGTANIEL